MATVVPLMRHEQIFSPPTFPVADAAGARMEEEECEGLVLAGHQRARSIGNTDAERCCPELMQYSAAVAHEVPVAVWTPTPTRTPATTTPGETERISLEERVSDLSLYNDLVGLTPAYVHRAVVEVQADIVRLSAPVRFRVSGLGDNGHGQGLLQQVLGMWRSAHAILGKDTLRLYTSASLRRGALVVNDAKRSFIEVPVGAGTRLDRRRTPAQFRPTFGCQSQCEIVLTTTIAGRAVEVRMLPLKVSADGQRFGARECVADNWHRTMEDMIWLGTHRRHQLRQQAAVAALEATDTELLSESSNEGECVLLLTH